MGDGFRKSAAISTVYMFRSSRRIQKTVSDYLPERVGERFLAKALIYIYLRILISRLKFGGKFAAKTVVTPHPVSPKLEERRGIVAGSRVTNTQDRTA